MVMRPKGRKVGVGWGLEDVRKMGREVLRQGNGIREIQMLGSHMGFSASKVTVSDLREAEEHTMQRT